MNSSTHISKKHGAMQIICNTWSFWFKGSWYSINAKTIDYWTGKNSPLTTTDKKWFQEAIYENVQ